MWQHHRTSPNPTYCHNNDSATAVDAKHNYQDAEATTKLTGVPASANLDRGEDLTTLALESITHRAKAKGVTDLDTVQSSSCFSPPPTRSIAAAAASIRLGGSKDGCARGREDTTGVSLRRPAAAGERRDGNGMGRGLKPALNGAQLILACFSFLYLKKIKF